MVGIIFFSKTSIGKFFAACNIGVMANAGAAPNSRAEHSFGKIFLSTVTVANPSMTLGKCLKKYSFSMASFKLKLSMKAIVSTNLFSNKEEFSINFLGLYRRAG